MATRSLTHSAPHTTRGSTPRKPAPAHTGPAAAPHLGAFVRAHRERLQPADVGLPVGLRRRAPGLRREELATLCGISPTWLTWIEQGRTEGVSPATLDALATALRLTTAERRYLFDLASARDPQQPASRELSASTRQDLATLVEQVRGPAYALDGLWQAVAWNRAAARLFTGWLGPKAAERNLLRYTFLDATARALIEDWPERARRLVAEFRADHSADLDRPDVATLVAGLRRDSTAFDGWWRQQDVRSREGGERVFRHPTQGRLVLRQFTLQPAQAPDCKVIVLAPG